MSANPLIPASAIVLTQPEIPDLQAITTQIETFRTIATDLIAQAERATIASETDYSKGTDLLTFVKTNTDELEKLRKRLKTPIDAYAKMIQNVFLPIGDEFTDAKSKLTTKMIAFRNEQDRIARAEQERIRRQQEEEALARAAELEAQGKTEAAASVVEMASAPLPAVQKTEARRGSYGGKAGTTETWKAEITNMRQFLQSVLDGTTNFNLSDITVGQMALNNLAKSVKVECEKNGVKITKHTGLTLRS